MNNFLSQLLSLVLFTLIPFIPNDVLRYTAFGVMSLSLMVYFVQCNTLGAQIGSIEATLKEIEELFLAAKTECTRYPRFIATTDLMLERTKRYVSILHAGTMEAQDLTWKEYPHHLKSLMLEIKACRREMRDLRLSILRTLEYARQQKYTEDITHRRRVIDSAFPADQATGIAENIPLRMRSSRARQSSYSASCMKVYDDFQTVDGIVA
ncbi:hypothetical protein B0H10DRAFT_1228917 [Mycena sp. CBHHK59/15]|nr:hypothetical protein B0H10DRAFT_1228917 [Mycena sp. CBHHK59/15]